MKFFPLILELSSEGSVKFDWKIYIRWTGVSVNSGQVESVPGISYDTV
jgi:hypothetical protein